MSPSPPPSRRHLSVGGRRRFVEVDDEDPIVIHVDSEHPIPPMTGRVPVAFNCDLVHEEWGEGQVHGTTGGTMAGGIRNVLTFPPMLDG